MKKRIHIAEASPQVSSLIRFASQNILDSLANDLGELVIEMMRRAAENEKENIAKEEEEINEEKEKGGTRLIELDEDEVDLEALEAIAEPYVPPSMPTEKELMKMMVSAAKITPIPSESPSEESNTKVIFTWEKARDLKAALGVLRAWGETFAARGTGISCREVEFGIEAEFVLTDSIRVQYLLQQEEEALLVVSKIIETSVKKGAVGGPSSSDGSNGNDRALVLKAVKNMSDGLSKHLSSISLPSVEDAFTEREDTSFSSYSEVSTSAALFEDLLEDSLQKTVSKTSAMKIPDPFMKEASMATPSRPFKDPKLMESAKEIGLNLNSYEGKGLESQAVKQLQDMMDDSRKSGFLAAIRASNFTSSSINGSSETDASSEEKSLEELFAAGAKKSRLTWQEMLQRPYKMEEDLSKPPTSFPINLKAAGYEMGIDIFEGPPMEIIENPPSSSVAGQTLKEEEEAFPPSIATYAMDLNKIELLLSELRKNAEEMHTSIIDAFRDVLLSDNFLFIMKQLNSSQSDVYTRLLCKKIIEAGTTLIAELGALAKTESIRHLETIHDICQISAKFQQDELTFLREMDHIKPRFDTAFLGYLKFAMKEERLSISKAGSDPDRFPSAWLKVLTVIYAGVLAEFETRFDRFLEPLLLTVRFEQPEMRSALFKRFVNITQPLELFYMRQLSVNMATNILSMDESDLPDQTLKPKMEQLLQDIERYLSEEIIEEKVSIFLESIEKQGKTVVVRHRNPLVQMEMDLRKEYNLGDGAERGDGDDDGDNDEHSTVKVSESVLDKFKRTPSS